MKKSQPNQAGLNCDLQGMARGVFTRDKGSTGEGCVLPAGRADQEHHGWVLGAGEGLAGSVVSSESLHSHSLD